MHYQNVGIKHKVARPFDFEKGAREIFVYDSTFREDGTFRMLFWVKKVTCKYNKHFLSGVVLNAFGRPYLSGANFLLVLETGVIEYFIWEETNEEEIRRKFWWY